MKILVTGDWHIGVTSFGVIGKDGRNSRLDDVEKTALKIADFARCDGVDLLVHCGDIFHTNRPTVEEQLVLYRFLQEMESSAIRTRIIIGNHDYNSQLGKGHALKLFKELRFTHTRIFDETTWEIIDGHLFCWYPFAGQEPDMATVAKHSLERSILVCHSHLEGATVGAEPFEIKDDKATKFKDLPVDAVFAGHFHKPQLLGEAPLAFYPGSIQPVDFNERMDVKGVVIVDTHDMKWRAVGFDTRKLVQYDIDELRIASSALHSAKDAICKVNVQLDESVAHKFDDQAIRDDLMGAGAHSIASINLKVVRSQQKRDPEIKIDSNIRSNFVRFVTQRDYGDITEAIIKSGSEIIEESVR